MSDALDFLKAMPARLADGAPVGLTSVCSAHPIVIAAAFDETMDTGSIALIEATCNQVNQDGGYTGMTPEGFRDFVHTIAAQRGFPLDRLLLGGDHLGPNPWRKRPADEAMTKAKIMVFAYAKAGYGKIHLDASMACADDPVPLPDEVIAERAAQLAVEAEHGAREGGHALPAYIVGTEVPVPGGATEELGELEISKPSEAAHTMALHKAAFDRHGIGDAFARIVGLVVQPGVEFGNANVIAYDRAKARDLSQWVKVGHNIVFEAHSTDYQTTDALGSLVADGFCLLKVGPGLTFALREALYGLDQIAGYLVADYPGGALATTMEDVMCAAPDNWAPYYHGDDVDLFVQRHFSYSDRIRYYWTDPHASAAVSRLMDALGSHHIPQTLASQFLGFLNPKDAGDLTAEAVVIRAVRQALAPYSVASKPETASGSTDTGGK